MDQKVLNGMGVTPTELTTKFRYVKGLPNYSSVEYGGSLTVTLDPDADIRQVHRYILEQLKGEAKEALDPILKKAQEQVPGDNTQAAVPPPPPPTDPQRSLPADMSPGYVAPPPPPATAANATAGTEVWTDVTLRHEVTPNGNHLVRVKPNSGKWTKYGAPMWREIADQMVPGWQAWEFGMAYGLPEGITQAVVQLKPDGKPDKVIRLE